MRLGSLVVALLLALDVQAAAPRSPPSPTPATPTSSALNIDAELARLHFEKGRDYYELFEYNAALNEFESARRYQPIPALDFNIGRCLDQLGRHQDAITAYERYVATTPTPPDAAEVGHRIQTLRAQLPPPSLARPPLLAKAWVAPLALGVTAAAVGLTGAGLLASVSPDYDRLRSSASCLPCTDGQLSGLRARAYAGYALLGVAAAGAVVDLVLIIVAARRGTPAPLRARLNQVTF